MIVEIPVPSLVVLIGPAACGKTTFAKKHFSSTQIVSSDFCRALICDDEADQSISHHAFDLLYFILDKRLYLKRLTIVDSTALSADIRRKYLEIAKTHKIPVVYLIFNHSLDCCLQRNLTRQRVVEREVIERQYKKLCRVFDVLPGEEVYKVYLIDEINEPEVKIVIVPYKG
jgi:protein phosphatase